MRRSRTGGPSCSKQAGCSIRTSTTKSNFRRRLPFSLQEVASRGGLTCQALCLTLTTAQSWLSRELPLYSPSLPSIPLLLPIHPLLSPNLLFLPNNSSSSPGCSFWWCPWSAVPCPCWGPPQPAAPWPPQWRHPWRSGQSWGRGSAGPGLVAGCTGCHRRWRFHQTQGPGSSAAPWSSPDAVCREGWSFWCRGQSPGSGHPSRAAHEPPGLSPPGLFSGSYSPLRRWEILAWHPPLEMMEKWFCSPQGSGLQWGSSVLPHSPLWWAIGLHKIQS